MLAKEGCSCGDLVNRMEKGEIDGYLLKPVKRVTEYPLLVEKLLKHTPQDHADYHNTQEYICNIIILSKYQ